MNLVPTMVGTIERRLLINYRVDPDVLARILPPPFRPQVVNGFGLAGICLIRLAHLRPIGIPAAGGIRTENAAHRVAVEWDGPEGPGHGVYIPRRDTSSRLTALAGGRLFPGEHHRARVAVREGDGRYEVSFAGVDGTMAVSAKTSGDLDPNSVFGSLEEASSFFRQAPLGYSATRVPGRYEGLELCCPVWRVKPLAVDHVASSFFEDPALFPRGSAVLDSALLMRDLPAAWKARAPLSCLPTQRPLRLRP